MRSSLPHQSASATLAPLAAMVGSMVSLCVGTSFAKHLFPIVGAAGTVSYRLLIAAALLMVLRRPWRRPLKACDARAVVLYGLVLGAMNLMFYSALRTIPIGLAIAIEFTGPLAVALVASRKALDFVWVLLAIVGLALLLPVTRGSTQLDPAGVGFALAAAVLWALYIVLGQRVGHLAGGQAVAYGLSTAALLILPSGIATAGRTLLDPSLIAAGAVVALLSSAIPYSLEMYALRHLPAKTFGVVLSLEPAIGSLAALAILGERLSPVEWAAIGCIIGASAGSALGLHRARRAGPQGDVLPGTSC